MWNTLEAPPASTGPALQPAPHWATQVAPYVLLRHATQPAEALDAMRLPATAAWLEQHRHARAEMAALAQPLSDDLFALVPLLHEHESRLRRATLQLRRDAHQSQPTRVKPAELAEVQARLAQVCAPAGQRLAAWADAQRRHAQGLQQAEASFTLELQTVLRPALRAPLRDPSFGRALELVSPGVAASACRERKLPTRPEPDNFERSLFGYLLRASAKTSPLSSFMATSSLSWCSQADVGLPALQQQALQCRTRLNRGVCARLERAVQRRLAREDGVPLRLNPSFRALDDGRYRALCDRDLVLLRRPWREQRRAQFQLHAGVGQALLQAAGQPPAPWSTWVQRLVGAGVAAEQVPALLHKLLQRDLLQVPALADGFADDPGTGLLDQLQALDAPHWTPVRQAVQTLFEAAAHTRSSERHTRVQALARVAELERVALQSLDECDAEALQNSVVEDCWAAMSSDGGPPRIGPGAPEMAALQELRNFLAGQVEISPQYVRLREHFLQRYGAGGCCDDVEDFLTQVSDKLVEVNEYGNALQEGAAAAAPPGALMGVTAQVQLVPAAGPEGRPLMVVNKVFDRPGWLTARFAFGDGPPHQQLRAELAQWLQTLSGDAEPVDVMVNGRCNELQAHPRLTRRVLAWPGEPLQVPSEQQLPVAALRLQHSPSSGLLELVERASGRRINLLYLGSTFPTANWGVPFALSILTQPFRLQRPAPMPGKLAGHDAMLGTATGAAVAAPFVFEPRLQRGALVLRRASWWVRGTHLRQAWFATSGARRTLAVLDDCTRQGLPTRFFAQGAVAQRHDLEVSAEVLDGMRKPLWVDAHNPFSLALLERMAERFEWLSLTEALPDPAHSWLQLAGRSHVAELQIELLVHAT